MYIYNSYTNFKLKQMVDIKHICMLGFGDMGKGIAQVCLMAGYNVTAIDIDEQIIKKGLDYIKSGFDPVKTRALDIPCFVKWPLFPEHITVSGVWGLSFEQSVDYLQEYHHVPRVSALECLAEIPVMENETNPNAQDYSNRTKARKNLGIE